MLAAIEAAQRSVRLEMYIFQPEGPGKRALEALVAAAGRGVRVKVLVDALGSVELPESFWLPLEEAGGECRWFNPFHLRRLTFRDHRKLLVCDDHLAIVGGFNLMPEIEGDGIQRGWRDIALQTDSPLAAELAASFDQMFELADFRHKRFARFRKARIKHQRVVQDAELLFSGPGRGPNPIQAALHRDLACASDVCVEMAYFIPTWRIRRLLLRAARRGGRVRLILPARSDIRLSQLASRRLYGAMLRAGVEIHEYQPQTLHSKLIIIDGAVYVGSANLDRRSLHINYELMLRLEDPAAMRQARDRFEEDLARSERVDPRAWRKSRTFWRKLEEQWAWFLLARLDPWVARWQRKHLGRG